MLFSGKWFDPVIGIDIHLIQPPGPVPPIPVPHLFIGIVYDPMGLAVGMAIGAATSGLFGGPFKGPVLINGMPAANTGMHVKGMPVHIPIGGVFVNPPSNEGTIITGSKTVNVLGTSGARLTSMAITCNDPVNLPTSVVMSIPMGPPVFTGGPTAVDWMAAALSAIRTKWVSDKLHGLLGAEPGSWRSKLICFFTGHPVEVVSGRVMTDFVDFELPSRLPFKFERNYYSASEYYGPLGHGWHHSYDQHITLAAGRMFLRLADGRQLSVDEIEVGQTIYEPIERLSIERGIDFFAVCTADRQKLTFASELRSGRFPLSHIEDRNGNKVTLEYLDGKLVSITDCGTRRITFTNDKDGRLLALRVPHPNDSGADLQVARFVYDSEGDLIAAYDALEHAYRYEYSGHRLVKETNRNGLSFYFEYESEERDARCVRTWGDEGIYDRKITYYPAAHITIVEDSLGAKTTYQWNDAGLVTKITDALGGERVLGWDEFCRKVFEKDPEGYTQSWEYTSEGSLKLHRNASGGETRFEYNEQGLPFSVTDPAGQRWIRDYDQFGNVISAGLEYDSQWLYEHNSQGSVIKVTAPSGHSRQCAYNRAGLLISDSDYAGNITLKKRDGFGSVLEEMDAVGNITRFDYNELGKLRRVRLADGSEIRLDYDCEGNLTHRIGPDGGTHIYEYGPLTRVKRMQLPSGRQLHYKYNTECRLVCLQNESEQTWILQRDELGRLIEERDFEGRTLRYQYDRSGVLRVRTNGKGETTEFRRNPAGQTVAKRSSDGTFAQFGFDKNGRLQSAKNQWTTVIFERDSYGRVTREIQGARAVKSLYDTRGLRTKRSLSSGQETTFAYDANGRLKHLFSNSDDRLSFIRDPAGRPIESRLTNVESADSFVLRFEYDPVSRLKKQSAHVVIGPPAPVGFAQERKFDYDGNGNPVTTYDSLSGIARYQYDQDGRVLSADREQGSNEMFRYDAAGNLTMNAAGAVAQSAENSQFPDLRPGERWQEVGKAPEYAYDADGRRTEKHDGSEKCTYEWTTEGQLRALITASGERWCYEYDPFGRRIRKIGPSETKTYLWDGAVVAEEIWQTPVVMKTATWLFQPGSFRPLLKQEGGKAYACVTDQVGTPLELVTSKGELAWSGQLSTWGHLEREQSSGTRCPIRFQGQWFDDESGLTYNFHRYYDNFLGRFISPDPVGLRGGTRSYAYTRNPLTWVDPLGLTGCEGTIPETDDKKFALGLDTYLDDFAEQHGAETWKNFPDRNWREVVLEKLSDPDTKVLFNLEEVEAWAGVSRASRGVGGATDWELLQVQQNPQWWDSIEWWKGNQPATNPFL